MKTLYRYKLLCVLLGLLLGLFFVYENMPDVNALYQKLSYDYPYTEIDDVAKAHINLTTQRLLTDNDAFVKGRCGRHHSRTRLFFHNLFKFSQEIPLNFFGTAILTEAVLQEFLITGNSNSLDTIQSHLSKIINEGKFKDEFVYVDQCMIGHALMISYEHEIDFRQIEAVHHIRSFLFDQTISPSGLVPYRNSTPELLYVDTIGMICPFLSSYGRVFKDDEALQLAYRQLRFYYTNAVCRQTGLPFHVYDEKLNIALGLRGWTRGVGWYVIGLAYSIPNFEPKSMEYRQLSEQLFEVVEAVLPYQNETGAWAWHIGRNHAQEDISGTAMIGLAIVQGIKLGILPESYIYHVENILKGIASKTSSNGKVFGSLGDVAAVGVYPQVYGNTQWGQGYAQLLILEKMLLDEN